jgi:hypothetical protein
LYSNAGGANFNTAVGLNSGYNISSGYQNTCLGYNSGTGLTTGANCILIGNGAAPSSAGVNHEVTIGNSANSPYRIYAASWTNASDARDKTQVENVPVGLDFVNKLRPVSYKWDRRAWYENGQPDGSKVSENSELGFIAQELAIVAEEFGCADKLNLVYKNDPNCLAIQQSHLIPILVKAVQELSAQVTALQTRVTQLESGASASAPQ